MASPAKAFAGSIAIGESSDNKQGAVLVQPELLLLV